MKFDEMREQLFQEIEKLEEQVKTCTIDQVDKAWETKQRLAKVMYGQHKLRIIDHLQLANAELKLYKVGLKLIKIEKEDRTNDKL